MIVTSIGNHHKIDNFDILKLPRIETKIAYSKETIYYTNQDFKLKENYHSLFYGKLLDTGDIRPIYKITEEIFLNQSKKFDLRNDRIKIIIPFVHSGFGHFLLDCVGQILQCVKSIDNPIFLINVNNIVDVEGCRGFVTFLDIVLKTLRIDFIMITENFFNVAINNFYIIRWLEHTDQMYNDVHDISLNLVKLKDISPHRKVYVTSKGYSPYYDGQYVDFLSLDTFDVADRRMVNETYLMDFLKDNDFEIISLPKHFPSMEEQINYFYLAKTIFSCTGSGLVNMLFMQPKSNVIEIMNPFESQEGGFLQSHSNQYQNMAFAMEHNYFGKRNLIDGKLIVEDIKNNPKFLEMIK